MPSATAAELLRDALERDEDLFLARLSECREKTSKRTYSDEEAWVSVDRIEYLEGVVTRDIPDLTTSMAPIIRRAINARLTADPIACGKPLGIA